MQSAITLTVVRISKNKKVVWETIFWHLYSNLCPKLKLSIPLYQILINSASEKFTLNGPANRSVVI